MDRSGSGEYGRPGGQYGRPATGEYGRPATGEYGRPAPTEYGRTAPEPREAPRDRISGAASVPGPGVQPGTSGGWARPPGTGNGEYGSVATSGARAGSVYGGGGDAPPAAAPKKSWLTLVGIVSIVVLIVACGVGGYLALTGSGGGSPAGAQSPKAHDISSQQVDPAALTEAELYPSGTVTIGTSQPYQVVKTTAATDCKTAIVGDLATAVANAGCSQVVRATLQSADKNYVITAGIFNMSTAANAEIVNESIKSSVQAQKGRLTGFAAGGASDIFTKAPTEAGWDTQGHFLTYCVLARADGQGIDANDPTAKQIINDFVETYLKGTVIQARVYPPSGGPSGKPTPKSTASPKSTKK